MARLRLGAAAGEISVTSTAKTFLTLKAPANQRVMLAGFELCGKGTANTDTPVKVEIGLITTDGQTGSATSVTPAALDGDMGETPQTTAYKNYGTEPTTYGTILRTFEVHPQTAFVYNFPLDWEIILKGGQELGFRLTSNQNETMALTALIEE